MFKFFSKKFFLSNNKLHYLLIIVFSLAIYSNTLESPFVFDDKFVIVENPIIKNLEYMLNPLEAKVHKGHFEYESFKHRYIGYLTFGLNYWIHGLKVTGYHLVNLTIHIINGLILYWLVILTFRTPNLNSSTQRLTSNEIALFASLLFVCHPVQTQAVTYIWQRVTSLSTTFFLLSLLLYIFWRLEYKKSNQLKLKKLSFYLGSLILAIIAMKTKEIAFTLPLIIFIYEFIFFNGELKKRIFYIIPFFLTMFIIPISILEFEKSDIDFIGNISDATKVGTNISRWDYLLTQVNVIATYLRLIFYPVNQNLDYDFPIYNSLFNFNVLLSLLLLICIFALAIFMFLKSRTNGLLYRLFAFGIFWFFITLSVESSFIPIVDVIFEHRIYLPSVGFFIALITGLHIIFKKYLQKNLHSMVILLFWFLIIILSVMTYSRNNFWSSELALWKDNVEKSPNKARPYNYLGLALKGKGRMEEAIQQFETAIRIKPSYWEAHNNLGNVLDFQGQPEKAIKHLSEAIRIKPDSSEVHNNLGNVFSKQNRIKEAIFHYSLAVRIKPDSSKVLNNLGNIFYNQGKIDFAINYYIDSLKKNPEFLEAHNNLGLAFKKKGLSGKAIKHFSEAIRIKPDFEEAHRNLGDIFFNQGRNEIAIKHYLEALRINPDSVEVYTNIGLTFSKLGRFEAGIKHYLKALQIDPNYVEAHNNLGVSLIIKGNIDESIFHFRKAISINPKYLPAQQNLEKALKRK